VKAIYDSAWHHPFAGWLVTLAFLLVLVSKLDFFRGFLVLFGLEIIIDGWVTGGWTVVPSTSSWAQPLAIVFVILGDFRYFLAVESFRQPQPRWNLRSGLVAFAFSMVIPIISGVSTRIWPHLFSNSRTIFLGYELMFFAWSLGFRFLWFPRATQSCSPTVRAWLSKLTWFELVQYAGWALADIAILAHIEIGHVLRIVPNLMYYGFFIPFAYFTAPFRDEHSSSKS
jgi:hypothetical protein